MVEEEVDGLWDQLMGKSVCVWGGVLSSEYNMVCCSHEHTAAMTACMGPGDNGVRGREAEARTLG